jgi:hypothetical protein
MIIRLLKAGDYNNSNYRMNFEDSSLRTIDDVYFEKTIDDVYFEKIIDDVYFKRPAGLQKHVVVEKHCVISSCNLLVSLFFLPKKNRFFNMVRLIDMRLRH